LAAQWKSSASDGRSRGALRHPIPFIDAKSLDEGVVALSAFVGAEFCVAENRMRFYAREVHPRST
jgi:hypothetical protein